MSGQAFKVVFFSDVQTSVTATGDGVSVLFTGLEAIVQSAGTPPVSQRSTALSFRVKADAESIVLRSQLRFAAAISESGYATIFWSIAGQSGVKTISEPTTERNNDMISIESAPLPVSDGCVDVQVVLAAAAGRLAGRDAAGCYIDSLDMVVIKIPAPSNQPQC